MDKDPGCFLRLIQEMIVSGQVTRWSYTWICKDEGSGEQGYLVRMLLGRQCC